MVALVLRHPNTGQVIFDSSTITVHIRGTFVTTTESGQVTLPGLASVGTPFVLSAVPTQNGLSSFPTFQINGDVVSWSGALTTCRVVMASRC